MTPREGQLAEVRELGWFHPNGKTYVASRFTSDGIRHVMGIAVRDTPQGQQNEWLVYDLTTGKSLAVPVTPPTLSGQPLQNPLLYGSISRDDEGRCYLGGTSFHQGRMHPLLLQVRRLQGA